MHDKYRRIWVSSIYFHPEPIHVKGLEFWCDISQNGYAIDVWTGFPYYPGTTFYEGYKNRAYMREVLSGITIHRTMTYPSRGSSVLRRFLSYIVQPISSYANMVRYQDPDCLYVVSGPLTSALGIRYFKNKRIPVVIDALDLWPDSVTSSGFYSNQSVNNLLRNWSRYIYNMADVIICSSEYAVDRLLQNGVSTQKYVIYQSAPKSYEQNAIQSTSINGGSLTFTYAGNIGPMQDVMTLVKSFSNRPNVQLNIVGSGAQLPELLSYIGNKQCSNIKYLGRLPLDDTQKILLNSDILCVSTAKTDVTKYGVPQKIAAYMAIGKPILAGVHGASMQLLQESMCAYIYEPGNVEDCCNQVDNISKSSREELMCLATKALNYYVANMKYTLHISKHIEVFRNVL